MSGFSASRHEVDFFDVRVFNTLASSYQHQSVDQRYANHERQKMLVYGERVWRVEHGSLTHLVFTSTGGSYPSGTHCIKRLASKISDHKDILHSQTVGWMRCRVYFALLRSGILCLRESLRKNQGASIQRSLVAAQAHTNELG